MKKCSLILFNHDSQTFCNHFSHEGLMEEETMKRKKRIGKKFEHKNRERQKELGEKCKKETETKKGNIYFALLYCLFHANSVVKTSFSF